MSDEFELVDDDDLSDEEESDEDEDEGPEEESIDDDSFELLDDESKLILSKPGRPKSARAKVLALDPDLDGADVLAEDFEVVTPEELPSISKRAYLVPRNQVKADPLDDIDQELMKPVTNITFDITPNLRLRAHRYGWSIDSKAIKKEESGEELEVWIARWHYDSLDTAIKNLVRMSHNFIPPMDLINYKEAQDNFFKLLMELIIDIDDQFRKPYFIKRVTLLQNRLAYYRKRLKDSGVTTRRKRKTNK